MVLFFVVISANWLQAFREKARPLSFDSTPAGTTSRNLAQTNNQPNNPTTQQPTNDERQTFKQMDQVTVGDAVREVLPSLRDAEFVLMSLHPDDTLAIALRKLQGTASASSSSTRSFLSPHKWSDSV